MLSKCYTHLMNFASKTNKVRKSYGTVQDKCYTHFALMAVTTSVQICVALRCKLLDKYFPGFKIMTVHGNMDVECFVQRIFVFC